MILSGEFGCFYGIKTDYSNIRYGTRNQFCDGRVTFDGYVTKPVDREALRSVVDEIVSGCEDDERVLAESVPDVAPDTVSRDAPNE